MQRNSCEVSITIAKAAAGGLFYLREQSFSGYKKPAGLAGFP